MESNIIKRLELLERRIARQGVRERPVTLRALTPVPDNGFTTTGSPFWVSSGFGPVIQWTAAHATHNFVRLSFKLPAGMEQTLTVKGLMYSASAESTTIRTYYSSFAAGDTPAWDQSDTLQQAAVSIGTALVEVTIASFTPTAAGDTIVIAFRPRSSTNTNVTQNKLLVSVWLQ